MFAVIREKPYMQFTMKAPVWPKAYSAMPPSPGRLESIPQRAKTYEIATAPVAAKIQDKDEIIPTSASFAGSMMIPDPSILSAVSSVSCVGLILLPVIFNFSCCWVKSIPAQLLNNGRGAFLQADRTSCFEPEGTRPSAIFPEEISLCASSLACS